MIKEKLRQELHAVSEEIILVSDYFYQQKRQEGYRALEGLLGRLMMLTDEIDQYRRAAGQAVAAISAFDEGQWLQSFSQAMSAMEAKDDVLLADLLSLEIRKQLDDVLAGLYQEEAIHVIL